MSGGSGLDERYSIQTQGIVNVPLAILWAGPCHEKIFREISLHAAMNPGLWTESLNVDERLWLVDQVETMAIYGERVAVLDGQGEWLKIAAVFQPTKRNTLGYPGWVLENQISFNPDYLAEQSGLPAAIVTVPRASLFGDPSLTRNLESLSYQTRLPLLEEEKSCFKVRLPDGGTGYLSRAVAKKNAGLSFSREDIVRQARRFLGLRYLWGGTSSYGFDCSGLMYRLYQSQGIIIARDASEQAQNGVSVAKDDLSPGDLLFFARDRNPQKIHHVGMYVGEGLMIHSPDSKSAVRIEPFDAGIYGGEYWGARRYGPTQE